MTSWLLRLAISNQPNITFLLIALYNITFMVVFFYLGCNYLCNFSKNAMQGYNKNSNLMLAVKVDYKKK